MNYVHPIRDTDDIAEMRKYLRAQSERNYMLFVTGINSGLRISDILPLRVRDAKKSYFDLREMKTQKQKRIQMTPGLKRDLMRYIEGKEDDEYLFKSREGLNKPIGRSMAYKILREAADHVGLDGIGTHTLRKTFGYHFYMKYKDVALLQEIFNHSEEKITMRYIGINQDSMDRALKDFRI
ncbi:site-specific integrase [Lederbergia lenta]|uniref:site-specific integrase n=1 Tax=Lederbergia lenta TaxID=1467 RepID=UPI00203BD21C|nr:site-specific integrase [Lederbergia lenta]MCM3111663.1 site-specific integrase [Lederbergia lenta]